MNPTAATSITIPSMAARLTDVLDAIDFYNRNDPKTLELHGVAHPYEWVFSRWLSEWVLKLNPQASELLQIAARGQHVGRWKIPRDSYPMDRGGYLRWREELKRFHAKTVAEIMAKAGYSEPEIEKTRTIILKKYQVDADARTIEDALCLVFLEHQLADFSKKTPEDKMIDILRKSWKKMSEKGRAAALTIPFGPQEKILITKALESA
jgi:hypothetical protein